jgi:hypothetical protein
MSLVEFEMDLGDAGEFDFIVEYHYYPAEEGRWPGEYNKPEVVIIDSITYGGIDWTKQLKRIVECNHDFLEAARQDWLDEVVEHQQVLAGA